METGLHTQKFRIWYAVLCVQMVGPIFFMETITVVHYQHIIRVSIFLEHPVEAPDFKIQ